MPAQKLADKHSLKIMNMEPTAIPPNNSHQHLMNECDGLDGMGQPTSERRVRVSEGVTKTQWLTVSILCFVNLINYMDRFTLAGILTDIQKFYNVSDQAGGLLQTAFVLSYMLFAPIFGYLGDRFNRRYIMAAGVFLWCVTTFIGSFMNEYHWFLLFRTLVGIGEASYSTIAPTIISDLFVQDMRSKMLALFYFAIPVGSGLGYIVGAETAKLAGYWQAGLRVTPVLGIFAVIFILFFMIDPVRGGAEGKSHLSPTCWSEDIKHLVKNKSFMLSTAGFTCVAFVSGALAWWGPTFVMDGLRLQPGNENIQLNDVAFKFGATAMVSGLVGVPLGTVLAQRLRPTHPRADPFICAFGLLVSAPLIFGALITAKMDETTCYILIFLGEVFLNLNWSIVADILLYVVIPTRRSTAEAFQILISHAFGDAGSPYLIGLISDKLKNVLSVGTATVAIALDATTHQGVTPSVEFHSFQYALFITCFVEVLGGLFFLLTALFIVSDRDEACREVSAQQGQLAKLKSWWNHPHGFSNNFFHLTRHRNKTNTKPPG